MRTLYGLLALALPVILISPAFAEDIFIVTELGNMFPVEEVHVSNDENGDVAEKALESILSAITDRSRITNLYQDGNVVLYKPTRFDFEGFWPYMDVDNNVRKIAYIFDGAATKEIDIPSLYADYEFESKGGLPDLDRLTKEFDYTTGDGYAYDSSSYQIIHAGSSTSHSVDSDSHTLNLDGTGRVFIGIPRSGLTDTTSPMIFNVFSNSVSENGRIRLVDSPYDLTTLDHDPYFGFVLGQCIPPGCDYTQNRSGLNILAGSFSDSKKTSQLSMDQEIRVKYISKPDKYWRTTYHYNNALERGINNGSLDQVPSNGYSKITEIGGISTFYLTPSDTFGPDHEASSYHSKKSHYTAVIVNNTVTNVDYKLYDTLPAKTRSMTPERTWNLSSSDKTYLVADLENSDISVRVNYIKPGQTDLLHISNVPENRPYFLEINGKKVVDGGISTENGVIEITSSQIPSSVLDPEMPVVDDVKLVLYIDSDVATITNTNTPTVYDIYNHQFVADPGISNSMYSSMMYIKVPFSGDVSVSDVSLDETLPLPYLSGEYESGESMYVPFVTKHKVIHMILNGTQKVQIGYDNSLGQRELFLINDKTVAENKVYPHEVREESTTVAVSAYAVASADGTMNVFFNSHVIGTVGITNTHKVGASWDYGNNRGTNHGHIDRLERNYLPKLPSQTPLNVSTNTMDVYVNGDLVKSVSLKYGSGPDVVSMRDSRFEGITSEHVNSGREGNGAVTATRSVEYTYDDIYSGHVSIPVESGDIVEFYVVNNIAGFIDNWQLKCNFLYPCHVITGNTEMKLNIESTYIRIGIEG